MAEKKETKKKNVQAVEKTTMNFARRDSGVNAKKVLPIILAALIVLGLFAKFGFIDLLQKKAAANAEIAQKQSTLSAMETKLKDYDALYAKYGRYSYGWMDQEEVSTIDRMNILNLLEEKVMPAAQIMDLSVNGDVVTMNLSGITLQNASDIVKVLEQDPLVKSASVYSAAAENASQAKIFMSVVLNNADKEAKSNG